MRYLLFILLSISTFAKEQYTFEGVFNDISATQYQGMLILKNSAQMHLTEQPLQSEYSHLLDSSLYDAMFAIQKDIKIRAQKQGDKLVLTFYKDNELRPLIMLDAGHGGNDPGAIAQSGLKEKHVTLNFSQLLYKKLNSTLGEGIIQSRTRDQTITKYERLESVIQKEPYYLISIHADSYTTPNAKGMGILCLDDSQGSGQSQEILKSHNLETPTNTQSAKHIGNYILSRLKHTYHLHATSTTTSPLVILRSPLTTSILIELGFLSHPVESKNLANTTYIANLSDDISNAILDYLISHEGIVPIKKLK